MSSRKLSPPPSMPKAHVAVWRKWRKHVQQQIVFLRKRLGLTHRQFAERLGVTTCTSIRWGIGSNSPDLPTLLFIQQKFSLGAAYFFDS